MQLSDMRARVSQRLAEGIIGPTYYTTAEINAALNEGYRLFCLLTLGLESTASWSVSANTPFTHMLPVTGFSNWIAPLRITDSTGRKIRPARLADLESLDSGWRNSPGAPVRYTFLGADMIGLYKQPASGGTTLSVTFARGGSTLSADGDTPEVPAEYHPRLVDYGVYRCRQGEGAQEFAKAMTYFESFMAGAEHYANYVRARNLGAKYDTLPIEFSKFDRSTLLTRRPNQARGRA